MPSRLGDLQMAQHLGEIGARAEHPLALTDLANRLLRGMPVPLHCGHPPILGDSDPQHADSNQGPTSAALRHSLMRPPQRVARAIRSCCCSLVFGGRVGAGGRWFWRTHRQMMCMCMAGFSASAAIRRCPSADLAPVGICGTGRSSWGSGIPRAQQSEPGALVRLVCGGGASSASAKATALARHRDMTRLLAERQ